MVPVGAALLSTVSVAELLVVEPAELLTTARYVAPLSAAVGVKVYVDDVAPAMFTPLRCHWNCSGAVPDAVTEKLAVCPAATVTLAGCEEMLGAVFAVNCTRNTSPPLPRAR